MTANKDAVGGGMTLCSPEAEGRRCLLASKPALLVSGYPGMARRTCEDRGRDRS